MIIKPNELINKVGDWDHEKSFEELTSDASVVVNLDYVERHESTYSGASMLVDLDDEGSLIELAMNEDGWQYVSDVSRNILDNPKVMKKSVPAVKALVLANSIRVLCNIHADTNEDFLPTELVTLLAAVAGNNIMNRATKELYLVEEVTIELPDEVASIDDIRYSIVGKLVKSYEALDESIVLPIDENNAHLFRLLCHSKDKYQFQHDSHHSEVSFDTSNDGIDRGVNWLIINDEGGHVQPMYSQAPEIDLTSLVLRNECHILAIAPCLTKIYSVQATRKSNLNMISGHSVVDYELIAHDLSNRGEHTIDINDLNFCYITIAKCDFIHGPNNLVGKNIRAALIGEEVKHFTVNSVESGENPINIQRFCFPTLPDALAVMEKINQSEQQQEK